MTHIDISPDPFLERLTPRLRQLPAASRAKYEALAQARADNSLVTRAANEDLRQLRDKRHEFQRQLDEALGRGKFKPLPSDHPELKRAQQELDECIEAVARLEKSLEEKHRLGEPLGQLVYRLTQWLSGLAANRPIAAYTGPKFDLPRGKTAEAALEQVRVEIATIAAEVHRIQSAPLPSSMAKAMAVDIVDGLAAQGAPNPSSLLDGVRRIDWPMDARPLSYPVMGSEVILQNADRGLLPFFAWLLRDVLVKRLEDEIDIISDDAEAMTPAQRRKMETALANQLLAKERVEEALIEMIGQSCPRRPMADPRAVLGLADSLPGVRSK